jgi:hypothetical protein
MRMVMMMMINMVMAINWSAEVLCDDRAQGTNLSKETILVLKSGDEMKEMIGKDKGMAC